MHEVKDHSLAQFEAQLALTRDTLPRFHLYQVHSLTLDSPLFDDGPLLDALARLRDSGVAVGFSTSGPAQGETILRALDVDRAGGRPVLRGPGHLEPAGDQCRRRVGHRVPP